MDTQLETEQAIEWVRQIIPFAIKPTRKAKTTFVSPFTSNNAYLVVTEEIGKALVKDKIFIMPKLFFCEYPIISRFDSDIFVPPFRLGKKQKRAVLDSRGREVIIMPHNSEKQAQMYCDYLNGL